MLENNNILEQSAVYVLWQRTMFTINKAAILHSQYCACQFVYNRSVLLVCLMVVRKGSMCFQSLSINNSNSVVPYTDVSKTTVSPLIYRHWG